MEWWYYRIDRAINFGFLLLCCLSWFVEFVKWVKTGNISETMLLYFIGAMFLWDLLKRRAAEREQLEHLTGRPQ